MNRKILVLVLGIALIAIGLIVFESFWLHNDEDSSLSPDDAGSGKDVGEYVSSAYAISGGSYSGNFTPESEGDLDVDAYRFTVNEGETIEFDVWITPEESKASYSVYGPTNVQSDDYLIGGDTPEKTEGHIFVGPGYEGPVFHGGEFFLFISGREGGYTFRIEIS